MNKLRAMLLVKEKKSELVESISMIHYANFMDINPTYGRGKLFSGPCDRLAVKICLGHIKVWEPELEKRGCASVEYSKCDFCGKENAKNLVHNISY